MKARGTAASRRIGNINFFGIKSKQANPAQREQQQFAGK